MIISFITSCDTTDEKQHPKIVPQEKIDSSLVDANQYLNRSEEKVIEEFIKRYHWEMQKRNDGLRYWIYKSGKGMKAKKDMIATVEYTLSLINGDTCYTSKELGPKLFELGKYDKESGLDEGVQMMKLGDKAKFIIPSHLGFGLMGDGNKVPKKATLVYDIELINLKNK
ncbi:MAG: FKBP-type peptidyl-prolyl cis-trans isomerase [Bacteroidota bacterium]